MPGKIPVPADGERLATNGLADPPAWLRDQAEDIYNRRRSTEEKRRRKGTKRPNNTEDKRRLQLNEYLAEKESKRGTESTISAFFRDHECLMDAILELPRHVEDQFQSIPTPR